MQQTRRATSEGRVGNKKPKDVEISGISYNKSQDIKLWKEQSANEIRAQFKLRDLEKYNREYAFKTKVQLLEIIKSLIQNKQWYI